MLLKSVLPSGISNAIKAAAIDQAHEQRLVRLVGYMFARGLSLGIPFDETIEISKEHFRRNIGVHYLRDLDALRSAGIIRTDHTYKPPFRDLKTGERLRLGQCKRHIFNPQFLYSEPGIITYNETARSYITGDQVTRETAKLLSRIKLSLDERNLAQYVAGLVTPEYIRARVKIGEEIPPGYYHLTGLKYPLDRERLLEIARKSRLDLIFYRDKCLIAQAERFLAEKRLEIQNRYLADLLDLKQIRKRPKLHCSRNDTNGRLDHNLTHIKSELLGLITLDGEPLVSIDLKNSQFTLLALMLDLAEYIAEHGNEESKHIIKSFMRRRNGLCGVNQEYKEMEAVINRYKSIIYAAHLTPKNSSKSVVIDSKSGDLERFKKLTKAGKFYDVLAEEMSAAESRPISRADAKRAMFLAAFSSHRYRPKEKRLLAELFPDLVAFMDQFKRRAIADLLAQGKPKAEARDQGDAALAVMLQSVESAIFIDGILAELLGRNLRVFSKHDSILCKPSDLDQVAQVIREHLDGILGVGGYQLTISKT